MSEVELKEEIKNLVEQESDIDVLNNIKEMLKEKKLKVLMIAETEKAEADIKAGRVFTMEEVKDRLNKH